MRNDSAMIALSRNFPALNGDFDVLVIGGGINGAAIAHDCAARGFKTALVEKSDFGWATSAGCFKIVHGGMRYLQHFNIKRLVESVREQTLLRRAAPHLVRPLPFLVPAYGLGMKSKPVLAAGLSLYELLARGKDDGFDPELKLGRFRLLSKTDCLQIAPGLEQEGLSGAVIYCDSQMQNCERLTLAVVQSAASAGALVCNYAEAVSIELESQASAGGEKISRFHIEDRLSGQRAQTTARVVVNATGPWCNAVANLLAAARGLAPAPAARQSHSKGIQLVLPSFVKGAAVAVESRFRDPRARISRGGRSFFLQPWRGFTLVGTTDEISTESPDEFAITPAEINQFVAEVARAYRAPELRPDAVMHAFGGLRPLEAGADAAAGSGEVKASTVDVVIDHARDRGAQGHCVDNLVSVIGVKYTTFRRLGEIAGDLVARKLGVEDRRSATAGRPLYGGDISSPAALLCEAKRKYPAVEAAALEHITTQYGSCYEQVIAAGSQLADSTRPLGETRAVLKAEVIHAARHEMACKLSDVVMRRTELGTPGNPGAAALAAAADLLGAELGWSDARRSEEIAEVERCFSLFSASRG